MGSRRDGHNNHGGHNGHDCEDWQDTLERELHMAELAAQEALAAERDGGYEEGYNFGYALGLGIGRHETLEEVIENLMKYTGWTEQKAKEAIGYKTVMNNATKHFHID